MATHGGTMQVGPGGIGIPFAAALGAVLLALGMGAGMLIDRTLIDRPGKVAGSAAVVRPQGENPELVRARNFVALRVASTFSPEKLRASTYVAPNVALNEASTFSPEKLRASTYVAPNVALNEASTFSPEKLRASTYVAPNEASMFSPEKVRALNR